MLTLLREDRIEKNGWYAVLTNDFDAIDEQEEQARTEVRLTGELFATPTAEAFCDMTGYRPLDRPGRDGRNKPKPGPSFKWPTATEIAEEKRGQESRRPELRRRPAHGGVRRIVIVAPQRADRPEPAQLPKFRTGAAAFENVDVGMEFTVLWPGNMVDKRVFVCKERTMIMFSGGNLKEAVVFDLDGREMRIEARACWATSIFNNLGEKKS